MTSLASPIPLPDESLVSFLIRAERLQGRSLRIPGHVGNRFWAMCVQHSEACGSMIPGHVCP